MASSVGIGAHRFRPSLICLLLALVFIGFLSSLGRWQLQRMAEKQALFDAFARGGQAATALSASVARYQHVFARGRYDSGHQFLLDNMTHEGKVGFRVLTPFEVEGGTAVLLVDRGWIPAGATREQLPPVPVSEEVRNIAGRLDLPPARGIDLAGDSSQGWPRVLTYPKMDALEGALGRRTFPKILLLDKNLPGGYVRDWKPSTFPPERHLGYAITWFALAATVLVIFIVTSFKKES